MTTKIQISALVAAAALALIVLGSCMVGAGVPGTFDRSFSVSGPVRLELTNGGGSSVVNAGAAGEVRVHADFRVHSWSDGSAERRKNEMTTNPPVSQEGNVIRVGGFGPSTSNLTVNYAITVPASTQIQAITGSGSVGVSGIEGPANLMAGSGSIEASEIAGDVKAIAGSGKMRLSKIKGLVQATAGSGNIELTEVLGESRVQAGSGRVTIVRPRDAVSAGTESGGVQITGATADLRVRTASGSLEVDGNPEATTYWDFRTSSGSVTLRVPPTANLRLYARSNSGDIDAAIPITMEGTAGKHSLRARIGAGKARVEIETSSGNIALR
jgi:putative adhesin